MFHEAIVRCAGNAWTGAHLAGLAGKLVLDRLFALSWARRQPSSRAVLFTPDGERRFLEWIR